MRPSLTDLAGQQIRAMTRFDANVLGLFDLPVAAVSTVATPGRTRKWLGCRESYRDSGEWSVSVGGRNCVARGGRRGAAARLMVVVAAQLYSAWLAAAGTGVVLFLLAAEVLVPINRRRPRHWRVALSIARPPKYVRAHSPAVASPVPQCGNRPRPAIDLAVSGDKRGVSSRMPMRAYDREVFRSCQN